MQILLIIVHSKSIKSFFVCLNFLTFCLQKITKLLNCKALQKFNIKRVSLLKSPHVHKSAQEHFNQKLYKQKFIVFVQTNAPYLKLLVILKKLLNFSFYDIKIKIKSFLIKLKNNFLMLLNLRNFIFIDKKNYSNTFFLDINSKQLFFYYFKKNICWNFFKVVKFNW